VREVVERAAARARVRLKEFGIQRNAEMQSGQIEALCPLDAAGRAIMARAMEDMSLSARGYYRVLKLARTIADLDGGEHITKQYLMQALNFRSRFLNSNNLV
jgi:magnesium chelatase family protein